MSPRPGRWEKQNWEKMVEADIEIGTLNKQKKLLLESVRNRIICDVSSRMYYQYFTFKGLDYTRNIVLSLNFLQIFFQRNIFRKLRITAISSSQWTVVSTFWVIWGNVRCRVIKPLSFGGYTRIITPFHFTFFKNVSVSFVVSLTIERDIPNNT